MIKLNGEMKFQDGERVALVDEMKTPQFAPSLFKFISDHYGLRRACRHVLLGTSGTGKSTLARSVMLDMANSHRVLCYSSEESEEQTKGMLALRNVSDSAMKNLYFVHEDRVIKHVGGAMSDTEAWKKAVAVRLFNSRAEALFVDNITTSSFYEGVEYRSQIALLNALNSLGHEFQIPIFIVAHTKKGVKDDQQGLISSDDVRGPAALTNKAEFLYVYQKYTGRTQGTVDPTFGTVRVVKGRGVSNIGSTYLLDYDFEVREYFGDTRIPFAEFNKIYTDRAKLGGRE